MPGKAWDPARGFWERGVLDENGCLLWTGSKNPTGYGQLSRKVLQRTPIQAHRLAWILTHGDPGELVVMHICDVPACFNPDHLRLGTIADNNADMRAKGRDSKPPIRRSGTHCKRGHELTPENRIDRGHTFACRACVNMRQRIAYYRRTLKPATERGS